MSPPRSKRRTRRREPLNRDRITRAALEYIDARGIEALSTRRLGRELGVEAMALYRHFESREALLDGVAELMFSEITVPPRGVSWDERIRRFARSYRSLARVHPKAYPLLATRRLVTEKALAVVNAAFAGLREEGFSAEDAAFVFRTVGNFCHGTALDELAVMCHFAEGKARDVQHSEVEAFLHPDHFDAQFERGLDLLLDGISRLRRGAR